MPDDRGITDREQLWRVVLLAILTVVCLLMAVTGYSGDRPCSLADAGLVADYTGDSPGQPTTRRAMGLQVLRWRGTDHLVLDDGNGWRVWSLAQPEAPRYLWSVRMSGPGGPWAGQDGDNDFQLLGFSVCDDCRYGFAAFGKMGAAVVDFGQQASPTVADHAMFAAPQGGTGGLVFDLGGQVYLVAALTGRCGGSVGLFQVQGPAEVHTVQCLRQAQGWPLSSVSGGVRVAGHLYIADRLGSVHVFRLDPGPELTWQGAPLRQAFGFGAVPGYDSDRALLATASGSSVTVWDVLEPGQPVEVATVTAPDAGRPFNRTALDGRLLWAGSQGVPQAAVWDVLEPDNPQPFGSAWWPGGAQPYLQDYSAVVYGGQLYAARYSVLQRIRVTCREPPAPLFADDFETGDLAGWTATNNGRL
jgi:hypothetical protein